MSVTLETDDRPSLAILQGGKGSTNWLSKHPKGTSFLTREYGTIRFELVMFQIAEKTFKGVLLFQPNYTGGPGNYVWVDPIKFSCNMEPFEVFPLEEKNLDVSGDEQQ